MSKTKDFSILKKTYEDPKQGLTGALSLYEQVRDQGFTLKDVKQFLKDNSTAQVTKRVVRPKEQRQILAREPGHIFQVDLTDMSNFAKTNRGIKYLLTAIDVDSRYAWAKPIKNKTSEEVLSKFEDIIAEKKPEEVSSDNGSEFKSVFAKYLEKNGIKQVLNQAGDHNHMGIVESFHRVLRNRIAKFMTINKTTNYINKIDDIVEGYNNTKHGTTKGRPVDILNGKSKNMQRIKIYTEGKFSPGDPVRILNEKKLFDKGTVPRWSADVYVIESKVKNKYKTSYGSKLFRDTELQKINQTSEQGEEKTFDLRKKTKIATQKKKTAIELKKNDIDNKNIRRSTRRRTRTVGTVS